MSAWAIPEVRSLSMAGAARAMVPMSLRIRAAAMISSWCSMANCTWTGPATCSQPARASR